jgi:glycosyltransferase involved in cell wall biosynthesis
MNEKKEGSSVNYVFLCGIYPKDKEDELFQKSAGKLSFAANLHQWNIIHGLEENLGAPLTLINTYFLPSYPRYPEKKIAPYAFSHTEGAQDQTIGYRNLRGIRNFSQMKGIYRALKAYLDAHAGQETTVFVYTMRFCAMKAVARLKKKGYPIHACLIVPDVPSVLSQYGARKGLYNKISSRYNVCQVEKLTRAMDSFVLLSAPMKELVAVGDRPYCVVDGIYDQADATLPLEKEKSTDEKRIVYTGSLHREYGICDLLEAFAKISDPTYRLLIAGNGNALDAVKAAEKADARISYLGLLQKDAVKELQSSSTLLVNPRPLEGIDAKYSFPSKTIEYMLRQKPVLMRRLPGMDPIYEEYLFTPEKCGCEDFADAIVFVCELPQEQKEAIAKKARAYILEHKGAKQQMQTVLQMLNQI